jgi:hypothetical protein
MAMPPTVRTLRDLARAKFALVAVCQRCRHRQLLFPLDLAERLGPSFLVADLAPRLRCTECKALGMCCTSFGARLMAARPTDRNRFQWDAERRFPYRVGRLAQEPPAAGSFTATR